MKVHRFIGHTARECMAMVRDGLGPHAMILSNRPVNCLISLLRMVLIRNSNLTSCGSCLVATR